MRRLIKIALFALLLGVAYVAWPFYSALAIREAMISGDTETLNRKVDWNSLRTSLKASITPDTLKRLAVETEAPKPTVWQRVKAAVAPSMADTIIDRYVTPENLPVLLGYRQIYRGTVRPALGLSEPTTALAGTWLADSRVDRLASFWKRVRRAEFTSPFRFELEVEDKYRPGRRYVGTMHLTGLDWKLTGLTVSGAGF